MLSTSVVRREWRCARTSRSKQRVVPPNVTVFGMTLFAVPAWMRVTVTTALCCGSTVRLTICWIDEITSAAIATGSTVSCGKAPWPPTPSIVPSKKSAAAITGPGETLTLPTSRVAQRWQPSTA